MRLSNGSVSWKELILITYLIGIDSIGFLSLSLLTKRDWTKESFRSLYRFVERKWPFTVKGERNSNEDITPKNLIKHYPQWERDHKPKPVEKIVKSVPVQNNETVSKAAIEKIARMRLEAEENNRKAKVEWVD